MDVVRRWRQECDSATFSFSRRKAPQPSRVAAPFPAVHGGSRRTFSAETVSWDELLAQKEGLFKEACIQASGQEAASVEELGFRLQARDAARRFQMF